MELKLANWHEFVNREQFKGFMRNLNAHPAIVDWNNSSKPDYKNKITLQLDARADNYQFPDEDFCSFVNFPSDQLIRPFVFTNGSTICSCAIHLLADLASKYPADNEYNMWSVFNCSKEVSPTCSELERNCRLTIDHRPAKLASNLGSNDARDGVALHPLLIALLSVGGLIVVSVVLGVVYRSIKTRNRQSAAAGLAITSGRTGSRYNRRRSSKQSDSIEMSWSRGGGGDGDGDGNDESGVAEQEVFNVQTIRPSATQHQHHENTTPTKPLLIKKNKNRKSET